MPQPDSPLVKIAGGLPEDVKNLLTRVSQVYTASASMVLSSDEVCVLAGVLQAFETFARNALETEARKKHKAYRTLKYEIKKQGKHFVSVIESRGRAFATTWAHEPTYTEVATEWRECRSQFRPYDTSTGTYLR